MSPTGDEIALGALAVLVAFPALLVALTEAEAEAEAESEDAEEVITDADALRVALVLVMADLVEEGAALLDACAALDVCKMEELAVVVCAAARRPLEWEILSPLYAKVV